MQVCCRGHVAALNGHLGLLSDGQEDPDGIYCRCRRSLLKWEEELALRVPLVLHDHLAREDVDMHRLFSIGQPLEEGSFQGGAGLESPSYCPSRPSGTRGRPTLVCTDYSSASDNRLRLQHLSCTASSGPLPRRRGHRCVQITRCYHVGQAVFGLLQCVLELQKVMSTTKSLA